MKRIIIFVFAILLTLSLVACYAELTAIDDYSLYFIPVE